ncbi:MAG: hypothetical protein JF887_13165 [Candidatus Dormibacteraeota bacterium]|uniref:Uncharacterized protein n=1 Tax=Candidatus Amunia macphersoniae TaxID=3127014 RepID=A0A934KMG2_9BACT|nr:hypothetical protein [Candidatus Dormibacteraeota bacterium]
MNSLVEPGFAKDPPVKLNVNAKILGLVLLILGALGILLDILGLITVLGFCGSFSVYGACSFPIIWTIGNLVALVAAVLVTAGGYRMYQENPQGKEWVVYGLVIRFVGAVISLIGNLTAYSGLVGVSFGGAVIFGLIINLIFFVIIYYLVVVSRFPHQAPLSPPGANAWGGGGGPSAPPPPPMR